jgi:hypothetical protein
MTACLQKKYDFSGYTATVQNGIQVRLEWYTAANESQGRRVIAAQEILRGVYPFIMRFRSCKKKETKTEEQFALQAKLDIRDDEDKLISGAAVLYVFSISIRTATFYFSKNRLGKITRCEVEQNFQEQK